MQELLLTRNATALHEFFTDVGPPAACALCFALATPHPSPVPAEVAASAERCLSDISLSGAPEWRVEPSYGLAAPAGGAGGYGGASGYGGAGGYGGVTDESEPEWSAMHRGLCIAFYRMVHLVWDAPLLALVAGTADVRPALPMDLLHSLQLRLQTLARVIERVRPSRALTLRVQLSPSGSNAHPQAPTLTLRVQL